MNAQEVGHVLGIIAARYPNARLGQDEELTIQAWHITLEDIPAQPHAELALRQWFRERRWPPDASELRELALQLGGPTPAMLDRAEREIACQRNWSALLADPELSPEERQARQRAFRDGLSVDDDAPRLKAVAGGA